LSDSLQGIDELISTSQNAGTIVMVGYQLRFCPSLLVVRDAMARGLVGRLLAIRAEVGQYLPDWRQASDYRAGVSAQRGLGGGVVLELSHELDYVRWLGGEVEAVRADVAKLGDLAIDVEDTAEIILRLAGGSLASIHMDMLQRSATRTCKVIGSEGTIIWDGLAGSVCFYSARNAGWSELCPPTAPDRNDVFIAELEHFLHCVREGEPVQVDAAAGRRVVEIALAVKLSSDRGETVWLD
jgi:predicted dehydrogenase